MIYKVQVLPLLALTTVEVIAKPRCFGPTFRSFGCWTKVRAFLANNLVGAVEFAYIEAELSREVPVSFKIDASPDTLYLAKLEPSLTERAGEFHVHSIADSNAPIPAVSVKMMLPWVYLDAAFDDEAEWGAPLAVNTLIF